ncbi:hypothetical protein BJX61DRAFT_226652 [Aspergillus egyptiacus]|nr:hypothetical protein BJX61DRAFT_226652 [Aspergillus egyptiacus]
MQTVSGDPLDWTVDEVVAFLCHNPQTPWSQSASRLPRPDPVSLEASIRDNWITGEILLQDVDRHALKEDLGIRAFGHQSSMLMAIRYLQAQSQKFQQAVPDAVLSPQTPNLALRPQMPIFHPQDATPRPSPNQHANAVVTRGSGAIGASVANIDALNTPLSSVSVFDTAKSKDGGGNTDNVEGGGSHVRLQTATEGNLNNLPDGLSGRPELGRTRHNEQVVVDSQGRKRRRLDLRSFVEARTENSASEKADDTSRATDWYMGPDPLNLDQVFYPTDQDEDEDDQTFARIFPNLPSARRSFVNKRLGYFFRQSLVRLESDQGCSQWAVVPYKPSDIKSHGNKHFTLYTSKQGTVNVSKENINEWPQLNPEPEVTDEVQSSLKSLKPSDPFAYLLQKYPAQEDVGDSYPLYGDSGSEGEFDDETWQEIEDERREPLPIPQTRLGPMKINSTIKECISEYQNKWRASHLPKEEYMARKLWLDARRGKRVNQQIKALTRDVTLLASRLQKLQDNISDNEYTSQVELRTQCQCLEQTIFNIETQKWRISVLEKENCPPKVSAPPRPVRRAKPQNPDEESLDSDSDFIEYDSPGEFVIEDEGNRPQTSFASPSSSDGDDDIISVSGKRRNTRGQALNIFASTSPSPPLLLDKEPAVVDLTMDSEPDDITIETPPLNPVLEAHSDFPGSTLPPINHSMSPPLSLGSLENNVNVKTENGPRSSLPKLDDMDGIMSLTWELIEERKDCRRLLAKLVYSLSDEERSRLAEKIPEYQFSRLKNLVKRALRCLKKGSKQVSALEDSESTLIMRTASFYIAWVNCVRLGVKGIPEKYVDDALVDLELHDGLDKFYEELLKRLRSFYTLRRNTDTSGSSRKSEPTRTSDGERSTDFPGSERDLESADTPHKKRKREVKESQAAKQTQASAQRRAARQEQQKKKFERRWQSLGLANDSPSQQAITFKEPVIYLDPHIGQLVKSHQLDGIRFMWREIVEDKDQQGCLLAHTMGLGKTMQVISLLATISAAAASENPEVKKQVPRALRRSQTLILCPASLIENWFEEFGMWTPPGSPIGRVRRISTDDSLTARLQEVEDWYNHGGVLLISYQIFQRLIINNETAKRPKPLSDSEHEDVRKWLLKGPSIIVADEAHQMKNPGSKISAAAMQFRSRSRIALTGSPLANNLADYYYMVNWITEDYLGKFNEFKANYIEPIEEGLYADSTHRERRRSLMKLQVLKQILEPKINRADITVLEGSLPPKVEFVLTVPLTSLQKMAYNSYAAFVLQGRIEEVGQAQLWSWLAVLGLCCCHPSCFRDKLTSRGKDAPNAVPEIPGDEPISEVGLPNLARLISEQEKHFAQVPDIRAVELSARTEILKRIIEESIKAGDKVLVFSQRLSTLDYIEHVLKTSHWKYSRLDGSTPMASRQRATKNFNSGATEHVYLISTRAGGLGLNIPGANRVIIFDFSFSPMWEEQAVGRAYRLGQQKPVFVYRFLSGGTFEELIHHKAIFKSQLSVRVVDKKNPIRTAIRKAGDYLFPAKPVAQKDISEFVGKDPLVLDRILAEDQTREERLIRDITLTETFQIEDNDKLTDEEKKSVQEELHDEHLRRTDPEAYNRKLSEKQRQALQPQLSHPSTVPFATSGAYGAYQPYIPQSAHNVGPPALPPDQIRYALNPGANPATMRSFPPHAPTQARASAPNGNALVRRQPPFSHQAQLGASSDKHASPNPALIGDSAQQQQKAGSQGSYQTPAGSRTPLVGTFEHSARLVQKHPAPSGVGQSEPSKLQSPIIDLGRHETVGHREMSPRGRSAPVQPGTPLTDAPGHDSEPSSATGTQPTSGDTGLSSHGAEGRPNSSCKNQ